MENTNIMGYYEKIENTKCLECGKAIYNGRTDKKFCSTNCKTRYHNHETCNKLRRQKNLLDILERNYEILQLLLASHKKSVRLEELNAIGFKPDFCTCTYTIQKYRIYRCYNIEYYLSATRIYNITSCE